MQLCITFLGWHYIASCFSSFTYYGENQFFQCNSGTIHVIICCDMSNINLHLVVKRNFWRHLESSRTNTFWASISCHFNAFFSVNLLYTCPTMLSLFFSCPSLLLNLRLKISTSSDIALLMHNDERSFQLYPYTYNVASSLIAKNDSDYVNQSIVNGMMQ